MTGSTIGDQLDPATKARLEAAAGEAVEVTKEERNRLLRLLLTGKPLADAAAGAELPEDVAHAVASDAGWPNLVAVDRAFRQPFKGLRVPVQRSAPADDPAPEAAVEVPPALEATVAAGDAAQDDADHAAIERLRALAAAARSGDDAPDAVARLIGSWTHWELAETTIAAVAILPPEAEWADALAWVDGPDREG